MRTAAVLATELSRVARQIQRTESVLEKEQSRVARHEGDHGSERSVHECSGALRAFETIEFVAIFIGKSVTDADVLNAIRELLTQLRNLQLLPGSDAVVSLAGDEQANAGSSREPSQGSCD